MAELDRFPCHRMEDRGARKRGGILKSIHRNIQAGLLWLVGELKLELKFGHFCSRGSHMQMCLWHHKSYSLLKHMLFLYRRGLFSISYMPKDQGKSGTFKSLKVAYQRPNRAHFSNAQYCMNCIKYISLITAYKTHTNKVC